MSLVPYKITAIKKVDPTGNNVLAGAIVTILNVGGGYAQLWTSVAGTTPVSNPFPVDGNGEFEVWLLGGAYTVSVAGGQSWNIKLSDGSDIQSIEDFSSLATTAAPLAGMIVYTRQHTSGGIGGGYFQDFAGTITNDTGSKINNTITAGRHWKRVNPQKTPYEFGYLDGGVDAAVAINACITAYGDCFLDGGKTYNIQYQIDNPKRFWALGGVATLNCTSPTANTRFGSLNAAIYALGGVGNPLSGVDVQNITIDCNKLIGVTGSTGIKGFLFQRLDNFYQRNCKVFDCASYGFWDYDVSTTGTTYCSGTRDDCTAIDCQVAFEQVNVRGVTLNNCYGYISNATLGYVPECIYHAYGGADMQIVYNNCVGVADGVCPSIFLGLLEVKNLTMNDCIFQNNYNNGASIQAAIFFDASGTSNFDNITFKNCTFKSLFTTAVTLSDGSASTTDNTFRFINCEIEGYQIGVQLNVARGRYYFTDCDVRGRASLAVTPYAIYNNGTPTEVKVIGGFFKASTTGSGTPTISNMSSGIFTSTTLDPAGSAPPKIRQKVAGIATWGGDGSTYANLNVVLPGACLNWTSVDVHTCKVTGIVQVDYGLSLAASFPAAVAMAYPVVGAMVANNIYRFVGHFSMKDKIAHYEVTEYE
jgi:hypothetical protein